VNKVKQKLHLHTSIYSVTYSSDGKLLVRMTIRQGKGVHCLSQRSVHTCYTTSHVYQLVSAAT